MKNKYNKTTMYAKMFLVTPMVYDKLKRCLDKTDVATLDRINKPFFSNTQYQTVNQQPPTFPTSMYRDGPPNPPIPPNLPIPPTTSSDQQIENIVRREMGVQHSPIREEVDPVNVPEFDNISNPFFDDDPLERYRRRGSPMEWERPADWDRPIDWNRPISPPYIPPQQEIPSYIPQYIPPQQEIPSNIPPYIPQTAVIPPTIQRPQQVSTSTQMDEPIMQTRGTQIDRPIQIERGTQVRPSQVERGTQTAPTSITDEQIRAIKIPEKIKKTLRKKKKTEQVSTQSQIQETPVAQALDQPIPTTSQLTIPPSQSIAATQQTETQNVSDTALVPVTSIVPYSDTPFTDEDYRRMAQVRFRPPPLQPSIAHEHRQRRSQQRQERLNLGTRMVANVVTPQRRPLRGDPNNPHLVHFGEQLRTYARHRRNPLPPAISEVVFSGNELEGPPQPLELTYQPDLPDPRLVLQQPNTPSLVYRVPQQQQQEQQQPRLALTYQKKRPLPDPDYVPPHKIVKPYEGPIPEIVITPPQEEMQRITRGSKRQISVSEQPKKIPKIKNFQCDICGLMLSTKYSLDRHKARELRRLQEVENEDPANKSDFAKWLENKKEAMDVHEADPQPGSKRSATSAKLSNLRKVKRTMKESKPSKIAFPSWYLRPPEK